MFKVTQLIPAPSLFEQTRQMLLAIISLAQKSSLSKRISGPVTQSACMLVKCTHDATIDAEYINVGGQNM